MSGLRIVLHRVLFFFWLLTFSVNSVATENLPDTTWFEKEQQGNTVIHLYFYWSEKCPHCLEALPYLELLSDDRSDLRVHTYQLVGEPDNVTRYQLMLNALGRTAQSVPAFVFCNTVVTGYDHGSTPLQIESSLDKCRQHISSRNSLDGFAVAELDQMQLSLPFIGPINMSVESLPFITLMLAGVDAFNPCAFFVLMFLLSLMLHTRDRKRMFVVGGVFVFFSGLIYFLFMAAWFNLFRAIGHLELVTLFAGGVALAVGLINIKDFVWFKRGVSLTINDKHKPALYQRMRNMLQARSTSALLLATVTLALFANLYEFLCTAGFPMVYTRILTLSELSTSGYYAYLAFYNLIYVLPLLIIVVLFAWSMGSRKLQENEGRRLKLVSGLMMAALGLILVFRPELLQDIASTLLIIAAVIATASVLIFLEKKLRAVQEHAK